MGINFISQIVLAYYYGARAERDAYFSAMVVPTYIIALFVGSFTVVLLPFFVGLKKKKNEEEVQRFVSSLLGLCITALVCVAIIGFALSKSIVSWVVPGFTTEQLVIVKELFRILIFTIISQSISSFLTVFYHAENRFFLPALSPLIMPITSLIFVVAFNQYGIKSLALGTLIGSILSVFVLFPVLKGRVRFGYFFYFINIDVVAVVKLALPLFMFGAVYRLTAMAERRMASHLSLGSISYLGYGNQIYVLLSTIAAGSIATTFYPIMAKIWAEGNKKELTNYLIKGIRLILLITLPIAAIFIVMANPIIKILFQRGAFDSNTTAAVASTVTVLMGAFIFSSLGAIISKIFYITNRTILISIVSIIEVFIYILSGYLLSIQYSYLGLAAALTISTGFTIIVLIIVLLKEKYITYNALSWDILKILTASFVCGLVAHLVYNSLAINAIVAGVLSTSFAFISYFVIVIYILKINDAVSIKNIAKTILKRTNNSKKN
jgi:putative peptidoglycan lipid II flippase